MTAHRIRHQVRKVAAPLPQDWPSYRNSHGELWLNVASSHLVLEEFVNLDRSVFLALAPTYPVLRYVLGHGRAEAVRMMREARRKAPLINHDCRQSLPFPDGVVDHILCSHYLEHLPPPIMMNTLTDFARVLRPGGTLHVILPDLRYTVDRYSRGEIDADQMLREQLMRSPTGDRLLLRALEAVGGFGLHHHWMYDAESAGRRLVDAGFEVVERQTPSSDFRKDDPESLSLVGVKPTVVHPAPRKSYALHTT
jgi:predicted SAM-dependent methyltransferase